MRAFAALLTAGLVTAGLAACGTSPAPGGSPPSSVSASPIAGTSVPARSSASATPVMAPPITALPTVRNSSPGPPVTDRKLLTQADSGLTILLPAGREIAIVLGPSGMIMPWDPPVALGGVVIRVSASGGYPSSLAARAVFKAVRPGTAQLTSWTDARCLHLPEAQRCLPPQQVWQVTVIVSAG